MVLIYGYPKVLEEFQTSSTGLICGTILDFWFIFLLGQYPHDSHFQTDITCKWTFLTIFALLHLLSLLIVSSHYSITQLNDEIIFFVIIWIWTNLMDIMIIVFSCIFCLNRVPIQEGYN